MSVEALAEADLARVDAASLQLTVAQAEPVAKPSEIELEHVAAHAAEAYLAGAGNVVLLTKAAAVAESEIPTVTDPCGIVV